MASSARLFLSLSLLVAVAALPSSIPAADWPTYRNGPARMGATDEIVHPEANARWVYRAPAAPKQSWSAGEGRVIENHLIGDLTKYDDALHPVVVGNSLYFGSSVDHHLHCIDLETGVENWRFATDGPIRLAPTVADGKVYFGSDDGFAYCLSAVDGKLIWRLRGGPADEWLLARGELISRWPVRTSVLVDNGIAYFGAGIFPHEDVFLHAVNAEDGALIWRQDNLSVLDAGRNDLSPQGYLLASDDLLFVPSGRSLPAAIDRKTGSLLYKRTHSWRTTAGGVIGGVHALLCDDQLYTSGPHHWLAMEQRSGDVGFGWFAGRQVAVQGDQAYIATGKFLARLNRMEYAVNSRRRHELEMLIYDTNRKLSSAGDQLENFRKQIREAQEELARIEPIGIDWRHETTDDASLLITGDHVFLGGQGQVTSYRSADGQPSWRADVEGEASGIIAAGKHLIVSTNQGLIYSFASQDASRAHVPMATTASPFNPYPQDAMTPIYEQAAGDLLKRLGTTQGFCLVLGNEEGRLAYELAKQSKLKIYAVEADPVKLQKARDMWMKAGLYGTRLVVHHHLPDAELPYSNYFANAIVSDQAFSQGTLPANLDKAARHLKPLGGKIVLGGPTLLEKIGKAPSNTSPSPLEARLRQLPIDSPIEVFTDEHWLTAVRGPLPGAGNWSHQYGNPANTGVINETRVQAGLGVLWYGDPGPGDMVNRHEGAVGPLATNGRLFVQGETTISAYDAYNGLFLWRHENPAALRTGVFQNQNPSNLAANDERLFHFVKDICYELDAATGSIVRTHRLPAPYDDGRFEWGYIAVHEGTLFGAATIREELDAKLRRRGKVTADATDSLFAIDLESGAHRWTYQGKSVSHHTIAIGVDSIYFVDSSITSEQRQLLLNEDKSHLQALSEEERLIAEQRALAADVRRAVAIDISTGEPRWSVSVDVTDCSDIGAGGGKLSLLYQDNVLLLGGANANGHYWKQFVAGEFTRRRMVALSAADGHKLWAKDANYKGRPIVIGQRVLAEPWSFDLYTGKQLMRKHPLTGEEVPWSLMRTGHHCGVLTGCDSGMLMFRSGDTAFYDLNADVGAQHFAGHRLGCWINAIPANGLVMIPEASAGCVCQFSIASTIVMEPRAPRREWAIHSAVGMETPVNSMRINFGGPGDRKDDEGNLWFSYPRRKAYQETSLDLALDLQLSFVEGGQYGGVSDASIRVPNAQIPWLYSSWAQGVKRFSLPLLGPEDNPAEYRLRLHFGEFGTVDHQPAVFDVLVQGKPVLRDVTLVPTSEKEIVTSVHDISPVEVQDQLLIELAPKQGKPTLCAVEVMKVTP